MTLLEAMVALVILGLSAVGFLEGFQGASRSATDAEAWTRAAAYAEEGIESGAIGGAALRDASSTPLPEGFARTIEVRPWRGSVNDVVVTVTFPRGGRLVVHRLVSR
jgi:type II secretory pathway pseudopilin PulG